MNGMHSGFNKRLEVSSKPSPQLYHSFGLEIQAVNVTN